MSNTVNAEEQRLSRIKRILALAKSGAHFGESDFDRERYDEIADICNVLLAELAHTQPLPMNEFIPDYGASYATPLLDVRGGLFRGDKILLVQENADSRWTLPGGYADIGYSLTENIAKEMSEEASVQVRVTRICAIVHKAKRAYRPATRDFYKVFCLCEDLQPELEPEAGMETRGAGFFGLDELPPLSTGRVIQEDIERMFHYAHNPSLAPELD